MFFWKQLNPHIYEPTPLFLFCVCSYWTDNGACYYYSTGNKYENYEDLLVAVKEDADENGLPFRYVQVNYAWPYI